MVRFLKFLAGGPAHLGLRDGGETAVLTSDRGGIQNFPAALIDAAVSRGLVRRSGTHAALETAARSYLRRAASEREQAFLDQHGDVAIATADVGEGPQRVRVNQTESPLAALARLKEKPGVPFLPGEAIAAGERLVADFMRGQLQPRVTSSWEPRLAGKVKGSRGGIADLTESAMAARLAVNRAVEAMGPELSGVALDICCFMKGLETVERERQWPVRSAKLMLRAALLALSRHCNPPATPGRPRMQHWVRKDIGRNCELVPSPVGGRLRLCRRPDPGFLANAVDHRAQAVRALRRKMLHQPDLRKHVECIEPCNFGGGLAGIGGKHDRDQPADDMGVGIAFESHQRIVGIAIRMGNEPDLAGAAHHLVFGDLLVVRQIRQRLAEFDHIAIAVFPIIQEGEVVDDLVEGCHGPAFSLHSAYR
jgi:hypothetical protein